MEVLFWVCGVIVGHVITIIAMRMRRAGTLAIYIPTTEDSPYMTAELESSVSNVCKARYVTFKVEVRPLNTHE